MRNWFEKKNKVGIEENLLEPISYRELKQFEKDLLGINFLVASSQRFSKNYIVYHSRNYKKNNIEKSNSFTVKFDKKGNLGFGFVENFIKINNKFFAVITELLLCEKNIFYDFKGNFTDSIKSFIRKKYFDDTFQIVFNSKQKLLIQTTEIICKCFIINLLNCENFYYISEYITEMEHD